MDSAHPAWVGSFDLAHSAFAEVDFPHEKTYEACRANIEVGNDTIAEEMKVGAAEFTVCLAKADRTGPEFANFHLILSKIKKALDPANIANPTRFIDMEAMEKLEK